MDKIKQVVVGERAIWLFGGAIKTAVGKKNCSQSRTGDAKKEVQRGEGLSSLILPSAINLIYLLCGAGDPGTVGAVVLLVLVVLLPHVLLSVSLGVKVVHVNFVMVVRNDWLRP